MCGIVAIVNNGMLKTDVVNYIKQGLYVDSLRGEDATGLFSVNSKGEALFFKKPMAGPDFLQLAGTEAIFDAETPRFMVGHNRATTRGSNRIEHIHPVSCQSILLVHNGTLTTYYDLTDLTNNSHDTTAIAHGMHHKGELTTLEKLDGAYALVWWNSTSKTLNFARNTERPLYMAQETANKGWLIASEQGMIKWLAERIKINIKGTSLLKEGVWLSVPLDEKENTTRTKFKIKEKQTQVYTGWKEDVEFHGRSHSTPSPYYATTRIDDTFRARLISHGVDPITNEAVIRFQRMGDSYYGWVLRAPTPAELLMPEGTICVLRAQEPRHVSSDGSNKFATVIGRYEEPSHDPDLKYSYDKGDRVDFMIVDMEESRSKSGKLDIVGITLDNKNTEVKAYAVSRKVVDENNMTIKYSGMVAQAVITPRESYLIINRDTIIHKMSSMKCGQCDTPLTEKEVEENKAPLVSTDCVLCDDCYGTYTLDYKAVKTIVRLN